MGLWRGFEQGDNTLELKNIVTAKQKNIVDQKAKHPC
jgi:hypothetical protein